MSGEHEHALMAGAIFANQAGAVNANQHGLIILANVMHDLVPCSLKERRVDRDNWTTATHGDSRCRSNRMLLSDANVIEAIWICGGKLVEASSRWHTCCDGNNASVSRCGGNNLVRKERRVVRHLGRRCDRISACLAVAIGRANRHLGERCAMEGNRIGLSGAITATFLRTHMHDHRTVHGECLRERLFKLCSVMPIEHTNIGNSKIFKETSRLLHERDDGAA